MIIVCPGCKKDIQLDVFFDRCCCYWPEVNVLKSCCPSCREESEIRVENGRIWFGYVYVGGAAHFCEVDPVDVPGLSVLRSKDKIGIAIDGKEWIVESR
jgi:hypothetical protein